MASWRSYQAGLGKPALRVIKKADFDAYERRLRRAEALRSAAAVCVGAVLAVLVLAAAMQAIR